MPSRPLLPRNRKPVNKISAKKLAENGGRVPFSSITKKPTKKIRAVNPEAEARRKAIRRKKHSAYRRSETFKIVAARAGGRCEFEATIQRMAVKMEDDGRITSRRVVREVRCDETEGLEHHHKRYGRQFGGNERPEDMQVLCKQHHAFYESQHSTRRR